VTSYGNIIYKPVADFQNNKLKGWIKPSTSISRFIKLRNKDSLSDKYEIDPDNLKIITIRSPCVFTSFGRNDPNSSLMIFKTSVGYDGYIGTADTSMGSFICSSDGNNWNRAKYYDMDTDNNERVTGAVYAKDRFFNCTDRSDINASNPQVTSTKTAFSALGSDKSPKWSNFYGGNLGGEIPFRGIAYNNTVDDTFVAIYKNTTSKAGGKNNGALVFQYDSKTSKYVPSQVSILDYKFSPLAAIASDGYTFAAVSSVEGYVHLSDSSSNYKDWSKRIMDVPISFGNEKITIMKHSSNIF
jgi:hypothetical protein